MTALPRILTAGLLLGAVLSGCVHLRPGSDELTYVERRAYLAGLDAWDLRGRIAIDNAGQAFQGRFQWSQRADSLSLTVRGPLGTNVLRVAGPTGRLTLEARGETRDLTDPEPQLSELVGWWLPVTSFKSWLLGIPDPQYRAREGFADDGALATLEQRLWALRFTSYQLAAGVLVPRRVDLSHGSLEFRVVIDSFSPAP